MCGIHFILDKNSRLDTGPIEAMVHATEYRGPDEKGVKSFVIGESQYFLGANKLSITDTSPYSRQPFLIDSGNAALIYNGEIYNYQDLKNQQLKEGVEFSSSSDTEVLYNHLTEQGKEGIELLNGMFAFVMLDIQTGSLIVARDRWGMKPLHLYEDDNYLIISSEIRGILASGLVKKELNVLAVNQYLKYRYVRRPHTFFLGIKEIEPNSWENFDPDGSKESGVIHKKAKYVQYDQSQYDQVLKHVDNLLSESVLHHLAPQDHTGLFLSGGVDSSLLLAKLYELGVRQVPTFSFVSSSEDKKHGTEDYKHTARAARQYQASHHEITTSIDILETIDDFIDRIDQPVGDSGALMTYLLSKEVKNLRVVLSGAGADEMFAGYNRHMAFSYYLKNYDWLKYIRPTGKLISSIYGIRSKSRSRQIQKFFQSLHNDPSVTWDQMISMNVISGQEELSSWDPSLDPMDVALNDDRQNYLINDVLAISDRMSMQASLEMRMPYLDASLSSYANSLSPELLMKGGPKSILKDLLSQKGGEIFAKRSKQGFGLPFGGWINKAKEGLWDFLETKNHIVFNFVPPDTLKGLLRKHKSGVEDNTLALWSLLILAKWLERNFD